MATTSLWRVKGNISRVLQYAENDEKTTLGVDALEKVVAYAAREEATNSRQLVTGINCDPKDAVRTMAETKKRFGKNGGTTAYHGYQSFAEGEVTPDEAHQIGIDLAQELWGERYEVVVCTHLDKSSHIHNHFVINTVSFVDGTKFHRTADDYRRMQEVSDRLCREHGKTVIRHPEGKGKNYSEWDAERNGRPTWRGMVRKDIDAAVRNSLTEREFWKNLRNAGYEFKFTGANGRLLERPSLKPPGAARFVRFDGLGEEYLPDRITERILENSRRKETFPEADREKVRKYRQKHPPKVKHKGLAALYYHYCYELGIIKRYPASVRKVSASMREDILRLEELDRQTVLLAENGIETAGDLAAFRNMTGGKIRELEEERAKLNAEIRKLKAGGGEGLAKTVNKRNSVTARLKELRKDLKLTDGIMERAGIIEKELSAIREETVPKITEAGKEKEDELFRGRGGTDREDVTKRG